MDKLALGNIFKRRKWILIFVPLISGLSIFAFKYFSKSSFNSTAQIATGITIQDNLGGTVKFLGPEEISAAFDNLIESIKSRPVTNLISYQLVLHDLENIDKPFSEKSKLILPQIDSYGGNDSIKKVITNKLATFASLNPNKAEEKMILRLIEAMGYNYASLQKAYEIGRLNKTDFINIKFTSSNKFLSAFVVNELCQEFIRFYTFQRMSQSDISVGGLEIIMNQKKEILDEKLNTLKNFKSRNKRIATDIEKEGIIRQISTYESLVEQETIKLRGLTLSLENVVNRINDYNQKFVDPSQRNSNLVEMKEKIDKLNEHYIVTGSKDLILLDSLKSLRKIYQREVAKGKNNLGAAQVNITDLQEKRNQLEVEIEISKSNVSLNESKLRSLRYSSGNFTSVEANASVLDSEIEIAKKEYFDAESKYTAAMDKIFSSGMKIKQVLIGEPADRPEFAKIIYTALFATLISFVLCVLIFVIIEFVDVRFKTPLKFKHMTQLKLAGPLIRISEKKIHNLELLFKDSKLDEEAVMLNQFLRKLRFEIEALNKKVFLITSTKKGEGKSFFIVSLAYALIDTLSC